ncbi:endonuclease domain-containing protein [Lacinutrix himadriensis]|uniref:endonuclease domain-containing protein n=1 Tax=Lacinutrix himadriensis TaxID=641549 RepID=UPI0006E28408|nr:endonuclease domain-containing protein [Lacinutrix himadriensis]
MNKNKIHTKKELKTLRAILRQKLTPAEAYLWNVLKARKFKNKRFTKQHSIGNYIVDFYWAEHKLIIELDGEIHNNALQIEKDNERTKYLENLSYKVIRFENKMVFDNLSSILMEIENNFK